MIKELKNRIQLFTRQNFKVLTVFLTACLVLVCNKYLTETGIWIDLFDRLGLEKLSAKFRELFTFSEHSSFHSLLFWVAGLNFFYLILPSIVVKFVLKDKVRNYGLNLRVENGFLKYYFPFMLVMLSLVYWASTTNSFLSKYPFYKINNSSEFYPRFLIWEIVYCSQFFCLEFFFRGFMVKGLQERFGVFSVFVMTIPYCMIHFGKPLPETIGSVFAGLILGYISYKGKGILPGFIMHITVALAMDWMALWQKGIF